MDTQKVDFIKIKDNIYNINFIQKITHHDSWVFVHTSDGERDTIMCDSERDAIDVVNRLHEYLATRF